MEERISQIPNSKKIRKIQKLTARFSQNKLIKSKICFKKMFQRKLHENLQQYFEEKDGKPAMKLRIEDQTCKKCFKLGHQTFNCPQATNYFSKDKEKQENKRNHADSSLFVTNNNQNYKTRPLISLVNKEDNQNKENISSVKTFQFSLDKPQAQNKIQDEKANCDQQQPSTIQNLSLIFVISEKQENVIQDIVKNVLNSNFKLIAQSTNEQIIKKKKLRKRKRRSTFLDWENQNSTQQQKGQNHFVGNKFRKFNDNDTVLDSNKNLFNQTSTQLQNETYPMMNLKSMSTYHSENYLQNYQENNEDLKQINQNQSQSENQFQQYIFSQETLLKSIEELQSQVENQQLLSCDQKIMEGTNLLKQTCNQK